MHQFRLRLLGELSFEVAARNDVSSVTPPPLGPGKPLALLAYLLAAPGRSATREELVDLLWGNAPAARARQTLRQTLSSLRGKFGGDFLERDDEVIVLSAAVQSDRQQFLAAIEDQRADDAVEAYTGPFFPGFTASGGANFEQWADIERSRLETLFVGAATRAVRARLDSGKVKDALTLARSVRDRAPSSQSVWGLVIESHLACNDPVSARSEFDRIAARLAADEMPLDTTLVQLQRAIERFGKDAPPPDDDHTAAPSALFAELVGREQELSALKQALERVRRGASVHVHISAPPGFGKTRLLEFLAGRLQMPKKRTLYVRAIPAERSLPYAFVGQLITRLVSVRGAGGVSQSVAATLASLSPAAASAFNATPEAATGDDIHRQRAHATAELVRAVLEDGSVALLIDDVHWMDPSSRTALASLAERMSEFGKLLLVTTARSVDRFAELTPSASVLTLGPLSEGNVSDLLTSAAALPAEPWAELLPARLQASTAGSPLLIAETLQLAIDRGALHVEHETWRCSDPTALLSLLGAGGAMQKRLAALPAHANETLLAMAIVGEPIDEGSLQQLTGGDARDATTVLESRGLAVRVNDRWRPAHDEIAAMVVELSSERRRVEMHQQAAAWLESLQLVPNHWNLQRATWHHWRSGQHTAASRTFTRLVERVRADRLGTPAEELARASLGAEATDEEVTRLAASLPRRLGRSAVGRSATIVGSAAVVLAAAALLVMLLPEPRPAEPDLTLTAQFRDESGQQQWGTARINYTALANADWIDVEPVQSPFPELATHPDLFPTDTVSSLGVIAEVVRVDSADLAMDLVTIDRAGRRSAFASKPHDQTQPVASPDGRFVAYLDRDFWDSQATEIMLYDVEQKITGRLTHTPATEGAVRWSPDGTRLAFTRESGDSTGAYVCTLAPSTGLEHCGTPPRELIPTMVHAWTQSDQLVIRGISRSTGLNTLALLELDGTLVRDLDTGAREYLMDRTGAGGLCICWVPRLDQPVVAFFSVSAPDHKVPLRLGGKAVSGVSVHMTTFRRPARTVARIEALGPDSVTLGESARLRVRGFDAQGRDAQLLGSRWTALDTHVAHVSEIGEITSAGLGSARVVVSDKSGLSDTLRVKVVPSGLSLGLSERWEGDVDSAWYRFGVPSSYVAEAQGERFLRINGDERLTSGVISRMTLDPSFGITVRVRFKMRVNRPTWQTLLLRLDPVASDAEIRDWLKNRDDAFRSAWTWRIDRNCTIRMPRDEGAAFQHIVGLIAKGDVVALRSHPPGFWDGQPHDAVLQVLPDGRCSYSMDGTLLGVSQAAIGKDRPLRVMLEGNSVGTDVRVLSVDVWRGVGRVPD